MTTVSIHHERECDGSLWAVLLVNGTEYLRAPAHRAHVAHALASDIRDATHARGVVLEGTRTE